jgi:hypothetical protein
MIFTTRNGAPSSTNILLTALYLQSNHITRYGTIKGEVNVGIFPKVVCLIDFLDYKIVRFKQRASCVDSRALGSPSPTNARRQGSTFPVEVGLFKISRP